MPFVSVYFSKQLYCKCKILHINPASGKSYNIKLIKINYIKRSKAIEKI